MNYDGLLSQLAEEKLCVLGSTVESSTVEEGAIEEEQAATIQTIPLARTSSTTAVVANSANKSELSTPHRKVSTSSRFINAFQQFYTGSTNSCAGYTESDESDPVHLPSNATTPANCRTPTKGMESKLLSMWHNVKYGWSGKLKSNFSKEQPVWLLGRCYHRKYTPPSSMESSTELSSTMGNSAAPATTAVDSKSYNYAMNLTDSTQQSSVLPKNSDIYPTLDPFQIDEIVVPQELGMDAVENQVAENPWEEGMEGFRRDFYSRIWMTYRREFPLMNGSNYTSDCGWGCMLRSGQMLLSQGLICHFLGRSWRYDPDTQLHSTYEDNMHKKIIKWFGDSSSKSSPFSIHALVSLGEELGKKPGDWYGPASVSHLLKLALKNASQENADFDNITVYVAKDCTIYMQDVEEQCNIKGPAPKRYVPWQASRKQEVLSLKPEKQNWKALIVLIPLRLGTEKLNPVYAHCLKLLLSTEYCIGIIGGRPKHSLYFVGFQEDKLIHLDPHYCQEMVDVNQENFPLHSFHCKSPRKLKMAKMDPSCCIGFYCQTKTDFDNFVESVQLYLHPMRCASGSIDRIIPSSQLPSSGNADDNGQQFAEMNYPLFTFSRGRCMDHERDEMSDSLYKPLQQQLQQIAQESDGNNGTTIGQHSGMLDTYDEYETEEFVLL